jgi:hypothetical protein
VQQDDLFVGTLTVIEHLTFQVSYSQYTVPKAMDDLIVNNEM